MLVRMSSELYEEAKEVADLIAPSMQEVLDEELKLIREEVNDSL